MSVFSKPVPLGSAQAARPWALSDRHYRWIMLLPALLVVLGLTLFPLLYSLGLTFTNWDLYNSDVVNFAGFSQWSRLLTDDGFLVPARNTIVFTLGVVPSEFLIGLIVALALNNATYGRTFFRIFFLVPLMVSPVATSFIMGRTMFDPSVGPIHDLLAKAGLPQIPWLTNPVWAMITLMIIDSWSGTAFMILLFTAGLSGMPQEPYEAAKVDGASDWQLLWHITLPLLAPVMVAAVLIRALDAFKIVDIIATVTGGGPGNATESLTLRVYNLAVRGGDVSYGATAAYGLVIIMAVFTTIFLLVTRPWVRRATGEEA